MMESLILSSLVVVMDSGSFVYCCPYDGLPCTRFDDDLGCGVCEIKRNRLSADVCSRFVLKPQVKRLKIDFSTRVE